MTDVAVLRSEASTSEEAADQLCRSITERMDGQKADAVILFASPALSPEPILRRLREACAPGVVVGCSSAGEFTFEGTSSASAVAFAIRSDDIQFQVHVAEDVRSDVSRAVTTFASTFHENGESKFPHRVVLLLMDVLAGYGEEFLEGFVEATSGRYEVFGGGAADDAAFKETFVFVGDRVLSDAAVGLEIQSTKPLGIGVSHGWTPFSPPMDVTQVSGLKIVELDDRPAADVIEEFARERGIRFDREDPLPFFLNHTLGIASEEGYKLRVPLRIEENGSVVCAAEVPEGSKVRLMRTRDTSSAEAARTATRRARMKLKEKGVRPRAALFFDCASTRLRLGDAFGASVNEVASTLGISALAGCNTYGQFARVQGQFNGFHNCTAVVCAFPE